MSEHKTGADRTRSDGEQLVEGFRRDLAAGTLPQVSWIVTAADLAMMKPTALFVNTSRAPLVAAGALEAALTAGRPGFAAVDVFEDEPVYGAAHPLLKMDNVVCTPHYGWATHETYEQYFGEAFDNVVAFAEGRPTGIFNPEVLAR